jgi:hypothetical protein
MLLSENFKLYLNYGHKDENFQLVGLVLHLTLNTLNKQIYITFFVHICRPIYEGSFQGNFY